MPPMPCDNKRFGRSLALLACVALAALVWLVILPLVAARPAIRRYVERNEALGIDPSAKFYTEMPGMPALFDRTDGSKRRHREAFGLPR